MTTISKDFNQLIQYLSVPNPSNHIVSLPLTANESFVVDLKHQTVTFDLLDVENSSISSFFNQYIDNSSSVQYATNDTFSDHTKVGARPRSSTEIPIWLIPCYSIILIFAIVGNSLVASTLFQNRRMRTITNVFLANLAISDMLLGVLCMPITLVGTYLRHFIFGELVCKFIQFAQAASVAASSWTLVAISCERYYAICHPLSSRTWQTINHAYKIIGCIWFSSIICMAPIAIFSQLIPTSRQGLRKCREQWPDEAVGYERFYNIFLDMVLLVLPLVILCVAYILIICTLYKGIRDEKDLVFCKKNNNVTNCGSGNDEKVYTQVEAKMKPPSMFHMNMSFRYHTRKGATGALPGSSAFATGCVDNDETLEVVEEAASADMDSKNKYSAMGATVYGRRGLCYNPKADGQAETEVSFKELKQQSNDRRTPSQHCSDDIIAIGSSGTEPTATTATAKTKTHKLTPSKLDGCLSPPVKSVNRNCIEAKQTTSCFPLSTSPTAYFNRSQKRHQSLNQKHHNQQQIQLMHFREHQRTTTGSAERRKLISIPTLRIRESTLRRSNLEKNLESKKRVVKMLFVLVLEFFICWTPLYVINTVAMFIGPAIYEYVDYTTISFFQLLAYSSSCCNPITYCFMNASFRRAFVDTFKGMHLNGGGFCQKSSKTEMNLSVAGHAVALANSCTVITANTVLDSPRL